jgi:hypothetical protein
MFQIHEASANLEDGTSPYDKSHPRQGSVAGPGRHEASSSHPSFEHSSSILSKPNQYFNSQKSSTANKKVDSDLTPHDNQGLSSYTGANHTEIDAPTPTNQDLSENIALPLFQEDKAINEFENEYDDDDFVYPVQTDPEQQIPIDREAKHNRNLSAKIVNSTNLQEEENNSQQVELADLRQQVFVDDGQYFDLSSYLDRVENSQPTGLTHTSSQKEGGSTTSGSRAKRARQLEWQIRAVGSSG